MVKKIILLLIIIIFITAMLESIRMLTHPLMKKEEEIKENLLNQTPLGTSMADVLEFLENNTDWSVDWVSYDRGFPHQGIFPNKVIGDKSIRVYMGGYRVIAKYYLVTDVEIYYGFDENSKLIDILVRKTTDTL